MEVLTTDTHPTKRVTQVHGMIETVVAYDLQIANSWQAWASRLGFKVRVSYAEHDVRIALQSLAQALYEEAKQAGGNAILGYSVTMTPAQVGRHCRLFAIARGTLVTVEPSVLS